MAALDLTRIPEATLSDLVDGLDEANRHFVAHHCEWVQTRHWYQVPPQDKDWHIWNMRCGRGSGKTRTGAEWIFEQAWSYDKTRWLVAAPTAADVRDTCFEGESGLIAVIPEALIKVANTRSLHEIELINGSIIKGIPASQPRRFRGPQFHGGWLDELYAWNQGGDEDQRAFDMIAFNMRLKNERIAKPRLLITSTPLPTLMARSMEQRPNVRTVIASTYENRDNLSPFFLDEISRYEGTRLGRQEIYADILEDEGGIFERAWIQKWPADKSLPAFDMIIMSIDPAYGEMHAELKKGVRRRDFTAVVVLGGFLHKAKADAKPRRSIMLLDAWQTRDPFPDFVRKLKLEIKAKYGGDITPLIKPIVGPKTVEGYGRSADHIVIEEKASGITLRQVLAEKGIVTFPYNPGKADKLTRGHIVTDVVKDGRFFTVASVENPTAERKWAEEPIAQLVSYAGEKTIPYDDFYDAIVQGLRILKDIYIRYGKPEDPVEVEQVRVLEDYQSGVIQPRKNPYGS
jgi:phage terminase large subunit-like protein